MSKHEKDFQQVPNVRNLECWRRFKTDHLGVRIKTWTGFMWLGQVFACIPQDLNAPEIP